MSKLLEPEQQLRSLATDADGRAADVRAYRMVLRGRVQGFGMRPTIARLAQELGLAGFVRNCNSGVLIHVEGAAPLVHLLLDRLPTRLPPGARVEEVRVDDAVVASHCEFSIEPTMADGMRRVEVPPDIATCAKCFAEVADGDDRRHGYLFTTCTHCGPRYSLIDAMPYDRKSTGMTQFEQCPKCRREYAQPADRRFHSQTNSCQGCGPHLWLTDSSGKSVSDEPMALQQAVTALRQGKFVAVKGVGGYQLMVDATSAEAVHELRRHKQRWGKPLAVMVADMTVAESLAILNSEERVVLASAENPIVVSPLRMPSILSPQILGGIKTVGLMLPTTPLHEYLVRQASRPLVVTSGNVECEPLVFDSSTAHQELQGLADLSLHHDRPILRPIDDSVVQIIAGRSATIRLARGLAPLPLELQSDRQILALGGHQKAAIALTNGAQAVLGPHIGDLENESTRARYLSHIDATCSLYGAEISLLVHDMHPDYFTSRWAAEQPVEKLLVQHHHAHVAAGMLEHGWLGRQVLGVAWDGTGYGTDGTIWGGEFLLATAREFRRVACLRPFLLPGGAAAVQQPWRVAVALVQEAMGAEAASRLRFPEISLANIEEIARISGNARLCPRTTSAGRLFDGVAALLLGIAQSQFEGQPAMLLETECDLSASGEYEVPFFDGEPANLDWRPLIKDVLIDLKNDVLPGTIAMKFHRALAAAIVKVARHYSHLPVVLSGGCFHNRVLTELIARQFEEHTQPLGLPGIVPVNDGGLAAGQLAVAIARLRKGKQPCA